ncbi:ketopantoate reductase family protein [Pseudoalteromonas mariniglutinosa]|uniref:ketopantoate reductase family protein n=1 Tax=Pseudoalteromonas mariniglutinosa TaxID=206042 RepID=UPI00384F54F5
MANILIVGDGAIGMLYSYFLGQHHPITLLSKKQDPTKRCYQAADQNKHVINAHVATLATLNTHQFDWVIFAVKAFQVLPALTQTARYLSPHCKIILSHNGMGNVEQVAKQLSAQQSLFFLTTRLAGYKVSAQCVQHTGFGESVVGACNLLAEQTLPATYSVLSGLPDCRSTNDIAKLRWQKLLVNVAINPLSAVYNVKNGQLRAPSFSLAIMELLNEACQVANAQGVQIHLKDALFNAYKVMTDTQYNYSSMQQDYSQHRPTEIASICGYISEQGKLLNIDTPHNSSLYTLINK